MNQFKRQGFNHVALACQDSNIRMTVISILHHADVLSGFLNKPNETTMLSSFHVFNLDETLLEFAAIVQELSNPKRDRQHQPATAT